MWKLTTQQQSDQEDSRNERGVHTAVPDAWCFDDGGAAHTETFIEALIELQKIHVVCVGTSQQRDINYVLFSISPMHP